MFNVFKLSSLTIRSHSPFLIFLIIWVITFLMFLVNQYIIRLRHVTFQTRNHTSLYFQVVYLWYTVSILLLSGDIETNPGPLSSNLEYLNICHWNLNSIAIQNFIKIPLLEAYITVNKFDIICLFETLLDSFLFCS